MFTLIRFHPTRGGGGEVWVHKKTGIKKLKIGQWQKIRVFRWNKINAPLQANLVSAEGGVKYPGRHGYGSIQDQLEGCQNSEKTQTRRGSFL